MEKIVFHDALGQTGYIDRDLEVSYQGPWDDDIEDCIESIKHDYAGRGETSVSSVHDAIMIDLPATAPILKLTKLDSSSA